MSGSGGSRIFKRVAERFLGGRIFRGGVGGRGADFEGLYYQSRSDCTRPEAVKGLVQKGVAPPA